MSPKTPVSTLSSATLKSLSASLVQTLASASDDEGTYGEHAETIRRYFLVGATFEILQDLLKNILNTSSVTVDAATRFHALKLLLRVDIRSLSTGVFPHSYYEKILTVITSQGTGLQRLNLKGVWVREYSHQLAEVLHSLKLLKVLVIPHMVDDLVLNKVINLKYLLTLDISGDCNFTLEVLKTFTSNTLQVLYLGMFGKKELYPNSGEDCTVSTIAKLISNLPNLRALKTYSFTGSALLELYEEDPQFVTKLHYIHDTETSVQSLEAIVALCPDLGSVTFNNPGDGVIARLGSVRKLTSVKTSKADNGELVELFNTAGDNLHLLRLGQVKEGVFDISQLGTKAPSLVSLEFYKMKLRVRNLENYFMCLETVEVLYCDVDDSVVRYLLSNAPFLRRLVVGDSIRMTDGDIFRLCADSEFQCLEELWLSWARSLTVTAVELLMGHCPKLRVLGQLNGWDVSAAELEELKTIIVGANMDLTLLPIEM